MIKIHFKYNKSRIMFSIIFILLLVSSLNIFSPEFRRIGLGAIVTTLVGSLFGLLNYYSINRRIPVIHFLIGSMALIFLSIQLIGLLNHSTLRSYVVIFQFISLISFLLICSSIRWNEDLIIHSKRLSMIAVIFLFLAGDFKQIGAFLVLPLFFLLLQRKKKTIDLLFILLCLVGTYLSYVRSLYLLLLFSLATFLIWKWITRTKFRFITFFIVVLSGLFSFVFIYPQISNWKYYNQLNEFVWNLTGKRILSGRNILWEILIEYINKKPLTGYGTGIIPSNFSVIDQSAHNLYLNIIIQNGFPALIVFVMILLLIWFSFWDSRNEYETKLSASFFIGILIRQMFEIILIQNNIALGLVYWLIISVGISRSLYINRLRNSGLY